jgi:CRISPR-associated protein Cas1
MTSSALAAALDAGASVVLCGGNHHPVGMLLPIAGNGLLTERLRRQIDASLPMKKRLWTKIVQSKIRNQAEALGEGDPSYGRLIHLAESVRSGDPENSEAQASRIYWSAFFAGLDPGTFEIPFRRRREGLSPNNFLNYGYMVLRAAAARAIVAAGLQPALGLHHSNRENAFCLADDLMEPYRPWVDLRVLRLTEARSTEIDRDTKRELLEVLTDTVLLGEEKGPLLVALQKTAFSLCSAFAAGFAGEDEDAAPERKSAAEIAGTLDLPRLPEAERGGSGEER